MRTLLKRGLNYLSYSNVTLKFSSQQQAAFLTLSNEKKRNPLSLETITELHAAIKEVSSKIAADKLKILVLKGNGPVFSSGHDLKELKSSSQPHRIFEELTKTLLLLKGLPVVTLSVINGVAAAAGLQLALTCDLILATQKSTFSTPGVKWGLFCSTPGVQLVRSITSEKKAREMLLFGEPITAQQALQHGLVNKVLPDEQALEAEVNSYIGKLSKLSGEVIALGKEVLEKQSQQGFEQAYCTATTGMKENILTKEDCKEGLAAFAEKRHPHFQN